MSFTRIALTTLGTALGGAAGIVAGAALGTDVGDIKDAFSGMLDTLGAAGDAGRESFSHGIDAFEKLHEAHPTLLDLDNKDVIKELPALTDELKGTLTADELKGYEYLQQNWDKLQPDMQKAVDGLSEAAVPAAIGGGVAAVAGGYAGYKLSGGSKEDAPPPAQSWQDRELARRALRAQMQNQMS